MEAIKCATLGHASLVAGIHFVAEEHWQGESCCHLRFVLGLSLVVMTGAMRKSKSKIVGNTTGFEKDEL